MFHFSTKRWNYFNLAKQDHDSYLTFMSTVIKHCDDFWLADFSVDYLFCIFFLSVISVCIEFRNPMKNTSKPNLTLQKLVENCHNVVSVKGDSKKKNTEKSDVAYVRKVKYTPNITSWKGKKICLSTFPV